MYIFNIGDLIYFMKSGELTSGICSGYQYNSDGTVKGYDIQYTDGTSGTIPVESARPSAYGLVSPTPSPSAYPTKTPSPSASPSMTVTPSPVITKNLFDLSVDSWEGTNASVSLSGNRMIFKGDGGSEISFSRTFSVDSNSYYDFGIGLAQGTSIYAKILLSSTSGSLSSGAVIYPFSLEKTENGIEATIPTIISNSDSEIEIQALGSGLYRHQLLVLGSEDLTLTVKLYADPYFVNPAPAGALLFVNDTNLTKVITNVSLTPTPSATPVTPTPTPSTGSDVSPTPSPSAAVEVSVSPTQTVTPTPTITPSTSEGAVVSPTPSPSAALEVSVSTTITPTPSATPAIEVSPTPSPSAVVEVSASPTITPTPSPSASDGVEVSPTPSPSAAVEVSASPTPTVTPSATPAIEVSPTPSPSASVEVSASPTPTVTPSKSGS